LSLMSIKAQEIAQRRLEIDRQIADAALKSGRNPVDIRLVAVTKMHDADLVRAAIEAGLREFGENYAQEASAKIDLIGPAPKVSWHFIGHLQSNKAHLLAGRCALIQSVDREKIASTLSRLALDLATVQDVLVQIHLGDEVSKAGASIDNGLSLCEFVDNQPGLRLRGLMGVAPLLESDGSAAEPTRYFESLKSLFDQLPQSNREILSMGMSADFEQAILAGATLVRIGSSLFGARPSHNSL